MRALLATCTVVATIALAAPIVRAQTLGETTAATGIHHGLAGSSTGSAKSSLDAVKRKLPTRTSKAGGTGKGGFQTASSGGSGRKGSRGGNGSSAWLSGGMDGGKSGWMTNDGKAQTRR
jgi:hypothetical protein